MGALSLALLALGLYLIGFVASVIVGAIIFVMTFVIIFVVGYFVFVY